MLVDRIQFETSPGYLLLCLLLAGVMAYWLYRMPHPWPVQWNRVLTGIRAVVLFILLFLLLGPIIRQVTNFFEKPVWVIQVDNSRSVQQQQDSLVLNKTLAALRQTQQLLINKGFDVVMSDLQGNLITNLPVFNAPVTDLGAALKHVVASYEGKKVAGVIMLSDGIYTQGNSPLYTNVNFPVYTVGIGDTLQRLDVAIKNVAYNKITYQGNRFPVQVELVSRNINPQSLRVSLRKGNVVVDQQVIPFLDNDFKTVSFQAVAADKGIQKLDVTVETIAGEVNTHNNRASIFVEVVEGKKRILLAAAAPHPDVKALHEVLSRNTNYSTVLYIPGVTKVNEKEILPADIDFAIFHQIPDLRGRTHALFLQYAKATVPLFLIAGTQSDFRMLTKNNMPVQTEGLPREFDEVTPILNPAFSHFTLSPANVTALTHYPPVSVHFGKITTPLSATPLLLQQFGNLATQKPLLVVSDQNDRKIAFMFGEGIWRWRLNEYDRTETTAAFDELFGKLIQYLSTTDDKKKFRSYPTQQEFAETQPVVFESQVFNDLFEPVYGNTIEIVITGADGKQYRYSYVTNSGNSRYQIGGLSDGVYQYRSSTILKNGKKEEARGEFVVLKQDQELQNLTADFELLRKLSASTGGSFYHADQQDQLISKLQQQQATSSILTEETFKAVINLKWIFWILLVLFSVEWLSRKYWGGY